jgi:hypothetical protein
MQNAALFLSKEILDELELTVEDIETGAVTVDDLLKSCLIPAAARLTGVLVGARSNPLLEPTPQVCGTRAPAPARQRESSPPRGCVRTLAVPLLLARACDSSASLL